MGIVISKNSALNDSFWKDTDRALRAVMLDADKEKTQYDKLVSDLAIEEKSSAYAEKTSGQTTLASFDVVEEGDKAPVDDMQETRPKLIVHEEFSKTVVITKQMVDDNQYKKTMKIPKNLVHAYKRTRAELASNALTTEAAEFYVGPNKRKALDRTTNDGLNLFHTSHTAVKANVPVQSNVFTNPFGNDDVMLGRLANIGRNYLDDSGNPMGFTFDTIVIPGNAYALERTIKKVIRSELQVGSDYNDVNVEKGLWKLIVDPLWQCATGTAPYIIFSSEARDAMDGMVFYDRTVLDIANDIDIDTRNLKYNGYARMSCGFNDWRWVIMGGASAGTTLS